MKKSPYRYIQDAFVLSTNKPRSGPAQDCVQTCISNPKEGGTSVTLIFLKKGVEKARTVIKQQRTYKMFLEAVGDFFVENKISMKTYKKWVGHINKHFKLKTKEK